MNAQLHDAPTEVGPAELTLSDMIPGYPQDHPQTLGDLVQASRESLTDPRAVALQMQMTQSALTHERVRLRNTIDVRDMLAKQGSGDGRSFGPRLWRGENWNTILLDSERHIALRDPRAPKGGGYVTYRSRLVPNIKQLEEEFASLSEEARAALYRGKRRTGKDPVWITIYTGSPDVLEKNGVAKALATLIRRGRLANALFYTQADSTEGGSSRSVLWSVQHAEGEDLSSRRAIPFPNEEKRKEVLGV